MKSLKGFIFVLLLSVTTSLTIQAAVITGQVRTKGSPISGLLSQMVILLQRVIKMECTN